MYKKLIFTVLLVATIIARANMVTISADTNILSQYTTDETCKSTLQELGINNTCYEVRKVINAFNRNPVMVAVILYESNFNKEAINHNKNGTEDKGVFQLNSAYFTVNGDIDHSIAEAKTLKITAWVAYDTGLYKTRLKDAYKLLANI